MISLGEVGGLSAAEVGFPLWPELEFRRGRRSVSVILEGDSGALLGPV
jgi:hypothetical protein